MPQLGETVAEGKITKWFKSAGDAIKPGDNLFEIETDKVSMEVPCDRRRRAGRNPRAGGRGGAGRRRRRGDLRRRRRGGDARSRAKEAPHAVRPQRSPAAPLAPGGERRRRRAAARSGRRRSRSIRSSRCARPSAITARRGWPGGTRVTPLARRLAAEAGIDLGSISPSGSAWPHRRARRRDRRRHAPPKLAPPRRAARPKVASAEQIKALYRDVPFEEVPLDGMRKTIAARLHAGEADHSAFLSDRRCRDRPAPQAARGGERGGAQGPGRQARLQALGQRFRHQGLGGGAAARAGGERGVGGGSHPALRAFATSASRSRSRAG